METTKLYDIYMMFGEDYRGPCLNFAIDSLNDVATYYNAYDFST